MATVDASGRIVAVACSAGGDNGDDGVKLSGFE
jgi:hypothetical protein